MPKKIEENTYHWTQHPLCSHFRPPCNEDLERKKPNREIWRYGKEERVETIHLSFPWCPSGTVPLKIYKRKTFDEKEWELQKKKKRMKIAEEKEEYLTFEPFLLWWRRRTIVWQINPFVHQSQLYSNFIKVQFS